MSLYTRIKKQDFRELKFRVDTIDGKPVFFDNGVKIASPDMKIYREKLRWHSAMQDFIFRQYPSLAPRPVEWSLEFYNSDKRYYYKEWDALYSWIMNGCRPEAGPHDTD